MSSCSDGLRLISGLQRPSAYGHAVAEVRVIETHISWVLLAGDFAYKLKKPVDLGFVDFTTLEQRRHYCEEEVRLNRRLAPELYMGVVPITGTFDTPRVGGEGEPIEYAVQMQRFPDEALLCHVLERGELLTEHIDALADEVAGFHRRIPVASPSSPYGTPESIWQAAEDNFSQLGEQAEGVAAVARLKDWSRQEFLLRVEDFSRRKALGFIRECHGDLHLGNMLLLDEKVLIFDCIEFNESFRWIDVLSEVAFAVMDFEYRGRPEYAWRLLNAYLERTGDYCGLSVLPFYLVYRAMVRAKVAEIRLRQRDFATDKERLQRISERQRYLELAARYTRSRQPRLAITHGLSGSGKTTVAQAIVEEFGAIRVRSDVERKRLFGQRRNQRAEEDLCEGIYAPDASETTYSRLAELAEAIVRAGYTAIVDAAFLKRSDRDRFSALASRLRVPFVLLDVCADEEVMRERVSIRSAAGTDSSDADLRVLEHQLRTQEPLDADEILFSIKCDTTGFDSAIKQIAELLAADEKPTDLQQKGSSTTLLD
jgi:aminoglycoside phosphotransferase family enzyme/predicted kinase